MNENEKNEIESVNNQELKENQPQDVKVENVEKAQQTQTTIGTEKEHINKNVKIGLFSLAVITSFVVGVVSIFNGFSTDYHLTKEDVKNIQKIEAVAESVSKNNNMLKDKSFTLRGITDYNADIKISEEDKENYATYYNYELISDNGLDFLQKGSTSEYQLTIKDISYSVKATNEEISYTNKTTNDIYVFPIEFDSPEDVYLTDYVIINGEQFDRYLDYDSINEELGSLVEDLEMISHRILDLPYINDNIVYDIQDSTYNISDSAYTFNYKEDVDGIAMLNSTLNGNYYLNHIDFLIDSSTGEVQSFTKVECDVDLYCNSTILIIK